MNCTVCEKKGFRRRWARWEITDTRGWRLYVCGMHVRRYRGQSGRYGVESSVLETIYRVLPSVVVAGVVAGAIARPSGARVRPERGVAK